MNVTQPIAQFGELRALGHEPPTHPRGVGSRHDEGALEGTEVEVGVAGDGVESDRLVGLPHEHGPTFRSGVQRNGDEVAVAFFAELAHGVDQPHRGFAPIDDGDAAHVAVHRHRFPMCTVPPSARQAPGHPASPRCVRHHAVLGTPDACHTRCMGDDVVG
jgi:hypothetical protein